jgi:hypothetical protein
MLKSKGTNLPVDTVGTPGGGVERELADLMTMARNWYTRDISLADRDGTEEFIVEDFIEKLTKWMLPYVKRMVDTEAITEERAGKFTAGLWQLCLDMREALRLPEPRKVVIPLDQRRISVP